MTILSKLVFPSSRALVGRHFVYSRHVGAYGRHLVYSQQVSYLPLHQKRCFRWDAKPDNQFSQSFKKGFYAPAHITFKLVIALLLASAVNWKAVRDYFNLDLPVFVKFLLQYPLEKQESPTPDSLSSSLALNVYEKYGDAGVAAMSSAWQEVKDQDMPADRKALHAIMMAQAAARYQKEVAKEAEALGLADDPEVVKMVEGLRVDKVIEGVGSQGKSLTGRMSLKAEEEEEEDGGVQHLEMDMALLEDDFDEKKHLRVGFRERKIIEYENRVRQYSTPDKVFRYFATYKMVDEKGNSEVMMTPEDFLRSITPGEKQPEHLGLDQFIQANLSEVGEIFLLQTLVNNSSVFYQLGKGGLISFSDYIFLLTVLSTSRRHFQIAFKMFDLNGDGTVDAEEFEKVTTLLRSNSSTGARHRDHQNTGSTFKGINSGLITYFFGEDRKGSLTVERFLEFQRHLQEEILALEFRRKDEKERGRISERDFATLLIAYAGLSVKEKSKMLKRLRKIYDEETSPGIVLKDYLNFYQVLYCINDIDTALTFHTIAGAPIERSTMKHVAKTVARVDLSDHLVDVVFNLFDANGDGKLSNKEFICVMKQRAMRGLEKPKDIGISRVFSSVLKCAADCKPAVMGGQKKTEY